MGIEGPARLYLIPTPLSEEANPLLVMPPDTLAAISPLRFFIVENEKSALRFLSRVLAAQAMAAVELSILDEHSPQGIEEGLLEPALRGHSIGLLSEAGCPAVADPGSSLVKAAHRAGIEVVPLGGSSSITLALMASGLQGQRFRFHGYLPRDRADRAKALRRLERSVSETGETQVFIETPYRNKAMLESLAECLAPSTRVCLAWGLGGPAQVVKSCHARDLPALAQILGKVPCTFLIGS
jgi:16S rRNA (cytidine1402-2'-O)-methyltransferase